MDKILRGLKETILHAGHTARIETGDMTCAPLTDTITATKRHSAYYPSTGRSHTYCSGDSYVPIERRLIQSPRLSF